jgi:hypothetical protein
MNRCEAEGHEDNYNFSRGTRGKWYRKDAIMSLQADMGALGARPRRQS